MDEFIRGAIALASTVAGLFFLRFWRDTKDRLFLIFALAFWLLGATRFGMVVTGVTDETRTFWYVLRLVAYVLIVVAILDKNRFWRRKT